MKSLCNLHKVTDSIWWARVQHQVIWLQSILLALCSVASQVTSINRCTYTQTLTETYIRPPHLPLWNWCKSFTRILTQNYTIWYFLYIMYFLTLVWPSKLISQQNQFLDPLIGNEAQFLKTPDRNISTLSFPIGWWVPSVCLVVNEASQLDIKWI